MNVSHLREVLNMIAAREPQASTRWRRPVSPKVAALFLMLTIPLWVVAQIPSGVYLGSGHESGSQTIHELKVTDTYLVYTKYDSSPAQFVSTLGGPYAVVGNTLSCQLEFNSAYEKDHVKSLEVPIEVVGTTLRWNEETGVEFEKQDSHGQPLDGLWLFATRGPDTGQERRGEANSRKTLKFLIDGHFQWIAYDTESMVFSGTGGGRYTASDGTYTEHIDFFSRDNNRVGASLEFNYEIIGNDWHHTGLNSRGEPMYEIWARR